eukprot:CAMPEP_0170594000 /NCGR_PEP_ID=MMETSP0224-20130122/13759_1 /TAXON_ID=285029 /ORGANISM="Togula jolla, Strain CCCM 725" /LENGTH=484 /DNA_ID=CAMNT_0010918013 /DNA_START=21 /DNA_END=1475 /DNA_ORIENTATION=-
MGRAPVSRRRRTRLLIHALGWSAAACIASLLPGGLVRSFALTSQAPSPSLWPSPGQQLSTRPGIATAALGPESLDALASVAQGLGEVQADAASAAGQFAGGLDSSLLTAFSDQGQNINGVLFQASLPAYLIFLYFLGYKGNNTPPLVTFGFSFLLLFVIATIPSGIIAKSTYGVSLADSDWLHGTAESLLTATNILIVLGFRSAIAGDAKLADSGVARVGAGLWLAAAVVALAVGTSAGFEAHTPFLAGVGALGPDQVLFPSVQEPVNALSVPTWIVHFSSVFEFLAAMTLAWRYAEVSGNQKWKGLTWGMLPSHFSSIAACTYHVFYNQIPGILTLQAACTFIGNVTLALAASRIAISNGWTISELNPLPAIGRLFGGEQSKEEVNELAFDPAKLKAEPPSELTPWPLLIVEFVLLTVFASYLTKYGEVGIPVFQAPDATFLAFLVALVPPSLVGYAIYSNSNDLREGKLPPLALAGALGKKE